jgi:hypothetical protein
MIKSDAAYMVEGAEVSKGKKGSSAGTYTQGSNGDLWSEWARGSEAINEACKVKAHLGLEGVAADRISFHDWAGNAIADSLAHVAAIRSQLPELVRDSLRRFATVAFTSLVRLSLAESAARTAFQRRTEWEIRKPCEEVPIESYLEEIRIAINRQGHKLVRTWVGQREALRCTACSRERIRKDMQFWMQEACDKGQKVNVATMAERGSSSGSAKAKETEAGVKKLDSQSKFHFITNEHHISRAGDKYRCRLCQLDGELNWFTSNLCSMKATQVEAQIQGSMLMGTMQQGNQANKAISKISTQNRSYSRSNAKEAAELFAVNQESQKEVAGQEAGEMPSWANEMEQHDLYYGAGLVWCRACSAVATTEKTYTKLRRHCRAREAKWVLPTGSKSRLSRLLKGSHPHGAKTWPDGRNGKLTIKFRKLQEPVARKPNKRHPAESHEIDMSEGAIRQLRRRLDRGIRMVDTISEEHCRQVALVCEQVASEYLDSEKVDGTPLQRMGIQMCIVAQGVQKWMQSEAGDELREALCEKTGDFENQLADEMQGWAEQPLKRRRCTYKTAQMQAYGFEWATDEVSSEPSRSMRLQAPAMPSGP